jgi:hypothetical protein
MGVYDWQRQQMQQQQQGRGGAGIQAIQGGQGFQQQQLQQLQQQQQQTRQGGLPAGGLESQMESINAYYDKVRNASITVPSFSNVVWGGGVKGKKINIGFDPQAYEAGLLGGQGQETGVSGNRQGYGNDLNSLARKLAEAYGLDIARGQIVDEKGNLLITPDQIQAQSGGGETLGSAAAKLNYLSAAITKEQNLQQQQKGIAALQTGLGQVQKRGRGSLAAMQSGLYQDLADMYSNQEFEAADYSFFIEKERMDLAMELDRRARDVMKKRARGQLWGGVFMFAAGAMAGNWSVAAQGGAMAAGAWGDTGYEDRWF